MNALKFYCEDYCFTLKINFDEILDNKEGIPIGNRNKTENLFSNLFRHNLILLLIAYY